jgi:hypothetical protein
VLGCGMVYFVLFGMGKILFEQYLLGLGLMLGGVICAVLLYLDQNSRGWGAEKLGDETAVTPVKSMH